MACDLTLGRLEACKENAGGIKAVYFVNYDGTLFSGATVSGQEITALAAPTNAYKYELKSDTNTYEETNENSRENGTSFWTQTGTIALKVQDKAAQAELKIMSYGRPHVIIEDYNGNFRLAGAEHGCEVQVNTAIGGAMGDFTGYNLVITGKERSMAHFILATIVDNASHFVVVEGT
jgi:hypothetical protein